MDITATLDEIIARLRKADWKERPALRDELQAAVQAAPDPDVALAYLEQAKKSVKLELRWEIEAVAEALAPVPEPEPEEEDPVEDDPNRPLGPADLNVVYDDPRGLVLHKSKKGERWFATQRDPRTGQPQTFELQAQEVQQLKVQLKGSPYWVLGAGATP